MGRLGQKIFSKLGVCEKSPDLIVQSQNELCRSICGDRLGQRCTDGCMKSFSGEKGFQIVEHVHPSKAGVSAVLISAGDGVTTLLQDKANEIEFKMESLRPFSLSPAESEIVKKVLQGYSNREIAAQLFISRATLKTHLNNIYKKIPARLKDAIRSGKK